MTGVNSPPKSQPWIGRVVAGQLEIEPVIGQQCHLADQHRGVALFQDQKVVGHGIVAAQSLRFVLLGELPGVLAIVGEVQRDGGSVASMGRPLTGQRGGRNRFGRLASGRLSGASVVNAARSWADN